MRARGNFYRGWAIYGIIVTDSWMYNYLQTHHVTYIKYIQLYNK